jgi:hypothetical protein
MNPEEPTIDINKEDKYSRGLRKLAREAAEIRNNYKNSDDSDSQDEDIEKLDKTAEEHYSKNKQKYQKLALEEATKSGVYIIRDNDSNLEALLKQGTEIIPAATEEEIRIIDQESKLFDKDFVSDIKKEINELIGNGELARAREPIDEFLELIDVRRDLEKTIKKSENSLLPLNTELKFKQDSLTLSYLESLGIEPERQKLLLEAWSSFIPQSIKNNTYNREKSAYIVNEIMALRDYIDVYGIEELKSVMDTFGITYFKRYKKESLHQQLIDWQEGAIEPVDIAITAVYDHNGALGDIESEVSGTNKDNKGILFFEARDSLQMAKFLVAIGNRERNNGRNPEQTGSVKNLVILAHGSPDSIALGSRSQRLATGDYEKPDSKLKKEINTYRNHLGNNFKVILVACSTAGVNGIDRNLAETISDEHDTLVDASMTTIYGLAVPAKAGVAVFRVSDEGKVETASVFDGREGDGVVAKYRYPDRTTRLYNELSQYIRLLLGR